MTIDELEKLSMSEDYQKRISVASDKSCSTDILTRLSTDKYDEVRMYVAGNPNTSPESLAILSQDTMWEARSYVAQNSNTPIEVLKNLLADKDSETRYEAMKNINMTTEVISSLVSTTEYGNMILAAQSEKCSYEDFVKLANYSSEYEGEVESIQQKLLQNKNFPFHLFQELIEKDRRFIKPSYLMGVDKELHTDKHLITWFDAFTDYQKYFGEENSYYARLEQAKSLNSSTEILEKLADDKMIEVREQLAKNSNTPAKVFEKLSRDNAGFIKTFLCMNPNVPTDILEYLYVNNKNHYGIKVELANHSNSPSYVLEELKEFKRKNSNIAEDNIQGYEYFDYITNHPNASGELLDKIYKLDLDKKINYKIAIHQNILFSTLKLMEKNLKNNDNIYKEILERLKVAYSEARDKETSPKRLEELSKYEYKVTRYHVALNPNTPIEILVILSNDENEYVRAASAKNKNTSLDIINQVYKDNESSRNNSIALHKDTTFEIATEISKKYFNLFFEDYRHIWLLIDSTPSNKLEEIYSTLNEGQKYQFVIGKNASFATLKLLAAEEKYFFKEYVYHHPNCTKEFKFELNKEIQKARDLRLMAIQKAEEAKAVKNSENRDSINELFMNNY